MTPSERELQAAYYRDTAERYDTLHVAEGDEHHVALGFLLGWMSYLGCRSLLDVGSGTGRALAFVNARRPDLRVVGLEPSAELRAVGHRNGLSPEQLVPGDAYRLPYGDGSFDVVCEFGVLHHLAEPRRALAEMLRVARVGVLVSDDNHLATGRAKRWLAAAGLWNWAYRLRTGGKGYRITEGDGLAYPYSVFDDLDLFDRACRAVHCMNTRGHGPDLRAGATHVALFGLKREAA